MASAKRFPVGWSSCKLGDVIELRYGKALPAKSRDASGSFAVFGSSGVVGRHSEYLCEGPCVVVGRKGSAGSVNFSSGSCWPIDTTYYVQSPRNVDLGFSYFLLRSLDLARLDRSTAVPGLNRDDAYAIRIGLPPLNEQRRIVEKIETLFAQLDKGEEAVREVQKLLGRYRQSILNAAVTGQLTADWREARKGQLEDGKDLLARILKARREQWEARGNYKEPVTGDGPEAEALPDGWIWATLDQLCSHLTSGSRDWKQYYGRGSSTFVMAQNVRPMHFDMSERFQIDPPTDGADAKRTMLRTDDLMITIVGANTGDICRFGLKDKGYYVCQSVALARPAEAKMSPFMELYLANKGGGQDQLDKFIYGAGRPHLSFEQLRSVRIPVPPLDEQEVIISRVSEQFEQLENVYSVCETELKRSAALRQSILKDAFAGRLVPQDPSDEPASELLARIAAEDKPAKKRRQKASA